MTGRLLQTKTKKDLKTAIKLKYLGSFQELPKHLKDVKLVNESKKSLKDIFSVKEFKE